MSRLAVNGFVRGIGVQGDAETAADVQTEALRFLRAGGSLSLLDWLALEEADRVAFERAGALLDEERAHAVALAFARGIESAEEDARDAQTLGRGL